MDHQKYCPGGLQKARVEKTSVLEVSRRRWIDKNSVLAAAGRLSIWRQVRTARTAAGGGKPPKQLFQRFSVFKHSVFCIWIVECIVTLYTPRGSGPVPEVSRGRWIGKNSALAAARRSSIWRQVRTNRTATGGGKLPKQLFSKISSI